MPFRSRGMAIGKPQNDRMPVHLNGIVIEHRKSNGTTTARFARTNTEEESESTHDSRIPWPFEKRQCKAPQGQCTATTFCCLLVNRRCANALHIPKHQFIVIPSSSKPPAPNFFFSCLFTIFPPYSIFAASTFHSRLPSN